MKPEKAKLHNRDLEGPNVGQIKKIKPNIIVETRKIPTSAGIEAGPAERESDWHSTVELHSPLNKGKVAVAVAGMELLFPSPLCPPSPRRPNCQVKLRPLRSIFSTATNRRKLSMASLAAPSAQAYDSKLLENRKHQLLSSIQDTQRGLFTTPDQRSSIEEALVSVEGYNIGEPINLAKLDGTWRLQYTSAPDVLVLLQAAATLPFFQVGQIFQKFECRDQSNGGIIRNVVRWSIPNLLEEQEGATLIVSAKFNVVSVRNIYLKFQEIAVQDINISEDLQALIAPAILPRSFISLQILQYLRAFRAQIPVRDPGRESVGGLYYLSYLDDNMLLGRAVGGGGVFVFTRSQSLLMSIEL